MNREHCDFCDAVLEGRVYEFYYVTRNVVHNPMNIPCSNMVAVCADCRAVVTLETLMEREEERLDGLHQS